MITQSTQSWRVWQHIFIAAGFAIASVLITAGLRTVLPNLSYPIIIGMVAVVGYFAGVLPALLCALWSYVLLDLLILEPVGLMFTETSQVIWFVVIMAIALLIGGLQEKLRSAIKNLQDTNARLDVILEAIEDGITVQDANAQPIYVNSAAAKMNGFATPQAMIATPIEQLMGKLQAFQENGQALQIEQLPSRIALREGKSNERVIQMRNMGGAERWLHVKSSPVTRTNTNSVQVVNIFRDITHTKRNALALEQAHKQNEKQLRDTLDNLIVLAGMLTPEGLLIEANQNLLKSMGLQHGDVIGKPFTEAASWAHDAALQAKINAAREQAAQGQASRFEIQIHLGKNKPTIFDCMLAPISDERLGITNLIFSAYDISTRAENQQKISQLALLLEIQRERLESILNDVAVMVWESEGTTANNQRLMFMNHYGENMIGYTEEQWRGMINWFSQVIHPDDLEAATQKFADHFTNASSEPIRCRFVSTDGHNVLTESRLTVIRDKENNPIGVRGVAVDITAHSVMESELRRSNEQLEQFAYVASHDLQEPLRMVTSYLQLIEQRYSDKLDDDGREFIGFAVDGATRMKKLIVGLLAYSRIQSTREDFHDIDMNQVVQRALVNLKGKIDDSQAQITVNDLPVIHGNDTMMLQLIQNLLSNALKFRKHDQRPEITITAERRRSDWMFTVKDNGIGIDKKYFERIFMLFQRLHGRSKYAGTGIGLPICKKIIERHEGKMWLASEPNIGSSFFFTLPHP